MILEISEPGSSAMSWSISNFGVVSIYTAGHVSVLQYGHWTLHWAYNRKSKVLVPINVKIYRLPELLRREFVEVFQLNTVQS